MLMVSYMNLMASKPVLYGDKKLHLAFNFFVVPWHGSVVYVDSSIVSNCRREYLEFMGREIESRKGIGW
jgi:hypothetical protein